MSILDFREMGVRAGTTDRPWASSWVVRRLAGRLPRFGGAFSEPTDEPTPTPTPVPTVAPVDETYTCEGGTLVFEAGQIPFAQSEYEVPSAPYCSDGSSCSTDGDCATGGCKSGTSSNFCIEIDGDNGGGKITIPAHVSCAQIWVKPAGQIYGISARSCVPFRPPREAL